jgi:hypothetical protein
VNTVFREEGEICFPLLGPEATRGKKVTIWILLPAHLPSQQVPRAFLLSSFQLCLHLAQILMEKSPIFWIVKKQT